VWGNKDMSIVRNIFEGNLSAAEDILKEKMLKEKEKCSSELEEAVKVKMVRAGQRIKKVPPKKGFKVVGNKYVRMTGAEKLARKRAVKKAVKTRKTHSQKGAIRKRLKSLKKRG